MAVDRVLRLQDQLGDCLNTLCHTLGAALGCDRVMLALVTGEDDQYPVHLGFGEHLPPHPHHRGPTLCHFVIAQNHTLALADTRAHAPYNQVGSVVHGGVQAYLGTPLHFGGEVVGSLCVIDVRPRDWSAAQQQTLEGMACLAEHALDAAWARQGLQAEQADHITRLRELEEGVIARQLSFRDVGQALGLLRSRVARLPASAEQASIMALCADLQWQMHETNQGVLASLATPGAAARPADTSWAELLALSVAAVDSPRLLWAQGPDVPPTCSLPLTALRVPASAQADALKAVVTVLRHCLTAVPVTHELVLHGCESEATQGARLVCQARALPPTDQAQAPTTAVDLGACLPALTGLLQPHLREGRLTLSSDQGRLLIDFIG